MSHGESLLQNIKGLNSASNFNEFAKTIIETNRKLVYDKLSVYSISDSEEGIFIFNIDPLSDAYHQKFNYVNDMASCSLSTQVGPLESKSNPTSTRKYYKSKILQNLKQMAKENARKLSLSF
jgi:hypothetical protein